MLRVFDFGEILDGRFRIYGELGRGGTAVVLAATDLRDDREIALKLLELPEIDLETRVRFAREARIGEHVRSVHIVRVLDTGELNLDGAPVPFIAMERLEGEDLGARLAREGPQRIERAVGWILDACDALAEVHAAGIVHRDLKPANLFLANDAQNRTILKVLDFGIARLHQGDPSAPRLTASSSVFGTPGYMAPEQLMSARYTDARADIYALGVVLYELVSGQLPFGGVSVADVTASVLRDRPRPLGAVAPGVPGSLERVVLRCLEKDPTARYQTVEELRDALVAVLVDPHARLPTVAMAPAQGDGPKGAPFATAPAARLAPARAIAEPPHASAARSPRSRGSPPFLVVGAVATFAFFAIGATAVGLALALLAR